MKIAILSNGNANYSTKRLVEVAKKRGHDVKVIKYKNAYASIEKSNPTVSYRGETLPHFDALIPRIASHMTRYGTAIVRQLEMQGMYTVSSSIAINRTRDKLRSMQLLAKAGVAIPKTVFSRNTADIDDLIEMVGGTPVIIKLATAWCWRTISAWRSRRCRRFIYTTTTAQTFWCRNLSKSRLALIFALLWWAGEWSLV